MTTGQGLLGNNMFAYCLNNPLVHSDNLGTAAVTAAAAGTAITILEIVATAAAVAVTIGAVVKKESLKTKSYTIYTLSDPATNEVVYVGRTTDFDKRMKAHRLNPARRGLTPNILEENLTYEQGRAAEQLYILFYGTLDKNNKSKNQINGVNPNRSDYPDIMRNGFGINEVLDSYLTNQVLLIFE